MGNKRYERKIRNYLINKDIQMKIVLTNLVYMVIITTVALVVLLSPLFQDMFLSDSLDVQYKAAETFLTLLKRLVPAVVLVFVLVFIHQVLITHRICGPLVNFTHTFQRIAEGDFTRKVCLRKGDYLGEECEKINVMVDSLRHFVSTIRKDHGKLVTLLEEILGRVEDLDTRTKLTESLNIVKREADLVEKDLSIFKIDEHQA
ncbi:MAG: methyl-accepting chemotaxis protein [Deltaproteobacteria bacterium]|nr:methyl-accepting chemotaxis protein [Deltaproteobacteria bacterium]